MYSCTECALQYNYLWRFARGNYGAASREGGTRTVYEFIVRPFLTMEQPELPVPRILLVLADSIRNLGGNTLAVWISASTNEMRGTGLQTEGIFRVPGDMEAVAALRVQVEANDYDLKYDECKSDCFTELLSTDQQCLAFIPDVV